MKLYTKQEIKDSAFFNSVQFIKLTDFVEWIKQKKDLATTMNDEEAIYILILDFMRELK